MRKKIFAIDSIHGFTTMIVSVPADGGARKVVKRGSTRFSPERISFLWNIPAGQSG
jgi:hypothetical protein